MNSGVKDISQMDTHIYKQYISIMKREKGEGLCENRDYAYSQKMYAVEEDRVLCKLRLGEGKSIWRNEWDAILLLKMYTLTNTKYI